MPRSALPQPQALSNAARRFERWRRRRTVRRIPEPLWKRAAALASRYGINRTAHALRLNYAHLKGLAGASRSGEDQATDGRAPFVELFPAGGGAGECVVELERSDGGKMRIQLKGGSAPDLAGLSSAFWGARG